MSPAQVHIKADRRLAFQVLTAWGAAGPDGKPTNRLIRSEGERLLIEFHTKVRGLLGREGTHTTQEWVTLKEPERITFQGAQGPLPLLQDAFVLEDLGPCTLLRYESTFGVRFWWLGWLVGKVYVAPILKRFMREHLQEVKGTIEARAARSKVFPQQPCPHTEAA
jgi:hypothetical protein